MKKLYFLLIIVFLSSAAFGQGLSTSADTFPSDSVEVGTVQADTVQNADVPAAAGQNNAEITAVPVATEETTAAAVESVRMNTAETQQETEVQAETVQSAVQAEEVPSSAQTSITKYQPEAEAEAVEQNEPTQRTKRRAFSLHAGLSIAANAANNAVSLTDFFQKEMVIDLPKIAKNTIRTGIHVGNTAEVGLFWHFTVLEEHTVRFSTMVDENLWVNIPKSILDLAAKGNAANAQGKAIEGNFNAKVNAFVDTGIMYQMKKPNYSVGARLAYFIPVAYMENPDISYSIAPTVKDGNTTGLEFKAKGTAMVYGAIPAGLYGDSFPSVPEILKAGGLDISLSGSYRPTNWVNITGGIDYLPLMVVTTNKGIKADFEASGSVNNILENMSKGIDDLFSHKIGDPSISTTNLPEKKIMRPGKIRIGADFRPLENNYLIVSPFLAFPFINAKPYYIDGGLKVESRFAKVLGASFSTACIERIWRHELALFLDSRFFTLTLAASIASQSFVRTFNTLSGLGIKFGIGIGL